MSEFHEVRVENRWGVLIWYIGDEKLKLGDEFQADVQWPDDSIQRVVVKWRVGSTTVQDAGHSYNQTYRKAYFEADVYGRTMEVPLDEVKARRV